MTSHFRDRLRRGPPLVLDGPTGTEFERRGADTSGPLWSARVVRERPDLVAAVHGDHLAAGADIVTAATFRATPQAFAAAGLDHAAWEETVEDAVALARSAVVDAGRPAWVAGSLAPVGDCYDPEAVPRDAVLEELHAEQAAALARARPDLILVETMNTVREARIAAQAAQQTGLPLITSLIVVPGGRLLSGEPLGPAVRAVAPYSDAVTVNCATLEAVSDALPVLRAEGLPFGAYPNAGDPFDPRRPAATPARYREAAAAWVTAGARLIGSCCGATPAHTAALRAVADRAKA